MKWYDSIDKIYVKVNGICNQKKRIVIMIIVIGREWESVVID